MPNPLIRYPLDATGIDANNLIAAEPHTLNNQHVRVITPIYGAFFTQSAKVYDTVNHQHLVHGVDFICAELLQTACELYGKEICYLIVVINEGVSSNVEITYQVLGGLYGDTATATVNLYETLMKDQRIINWIDILNKPAYFPPSPHLHDARDVYGYEYLVAALERVRNAIAIRDIPIYEGIMAWLKQELADMEARSIVTIATQAEAVQGTVNDKTMTPLRVKQAMDQFVGNRAKNYFLAQI